MVDAYYVRTRVHPDMRRTDHSGLCKYRLSVIQEFVLSLTYSKVT